MLEPGGILEQSGQVANAGDGGRVSSYSAKVLEIPLRAYNPTISSGLEARRTWARSDSAGPGSIAMS